MPPLPHPSMATYIVPGQRKGQVPTSTQSQTLGPPKRLSSHLTTALWFFSKPTSYTQKQPQRPEAACQGPTLLCSMMVISSNSHNRPFSPRLTDEELTESVRSPGTRDRTSAPAPLALLGVPLDMQLWETMCSGVRRCGEPGREADASSLLFPTSTSETSLYRVLLGARQLLQPGPHAVYAHVRRVESNPLYQGMASSADVALVELEAPVAFTNYILPVCVPDPSVTFEKDMNCWVTGWGSPSEQGKGAEPGNNGGHAWRRPRANNPYLLILYM